MKNDVQVTPGAYEQSSYNSLERFISYYYQIQTIQRLGPKNVLEIGVGNKLSAGYLRSLGIDVTTCDFDPHVGPDIVADIRSIPVPDNSFDIVAAFQVLEHIPFEDVAQALREFSRITRKYVIISVPYRSTFFEFVLKVPGMRTLTGKPFLDWVIRFPLRFRGFKTSGQHYWEIDSKNYRLKSVMRELEHLFYVKETFSPVLNKFHYFFILEKK